MKSRYLIPAGIVVLLLLARLLLSTAGTTPVGQTPLAALTDIVALRNEFNRDISKTRAVVLLSASCPYCLKGASTIEGVFARHRDVPLSVFVAWQPILATDWGRPGTAALGRISDERVRQFWDEGHLVAGVLKRSFGDRDAQPYCCDHDGIWWDLMAVFPPGTEWADTLPEPVLLDGTVEDAAPAFEAWLARMGSGLELTYGR